MLNVEVNLESLQAGLGGLEGGARDLSFATRGIAGVLADATERAFADEADPTTWVFPAHAGVVAPWWAACHNRTCLPRACGGSP